MAQAKQSPAKPAHASAPAEKKGYDFSNYKKDSLTKPRDRAWDNWMKFEKVGDEIQGFIRDAFHRPAEGKFKEQRGITIEKTDGELVNVGIKRYPFVLNKTDDLRLGDPLTIVLEEEREPKERGLNPTKIFGFYGTNLHETKGNKTVKELEDEDMKRGGTKAATPETAEDAAAEEEFKEF